MTLYSGWKTAVVNGGGAARRLSWEWKLPAFLPGTYKAGKSVTLHHQNSPYSTKSSLFWTPISEQGPGSLPSPKSTGKGDSSAGLHVAGSGRNTEPQQVRRGQGKTCGEFGKVGVRARPLEAADKGAHAPPLCDSAGPPRKDGRRLSEGHMPHHVEQDACLDLSPQGTKYLSLREEDS